MKSVYEAIKSQVSDSTREMARLLYRKIYKAICRALNVEEVEMLTLKERLIREVRFNDPNTYLYLDGKLIFSYGPVQQHFTENDGQHTMHFTQKYEDHTK